MNLQSRVNVRHLRGAAFSPASPGLMVIVFIFLFAACQTPHEKLRSRVMDELDRGKGTFAVAFKNLSTGEELLINECQIFHAASTMKVPVMIELFKSIDAGTLSLEDTVLVKNEFVSIADSSTYCLKIGDDSDSATYREIGQYRPLKELLTSMITLSSNLATNILIGKVDPKKITQSMRDLGANELQVLRGVEDQPAFLRGWNNVVTAYDLMLIYEKIAKGEVINPKASAMMTFILLQQKFNSIIPAFLPPDVKVAHKTGWLKGVNHDTGIVILPDGTKYVLVLLSKNLINDERGIKTMAVVSKIIFEHVVTTAPHIKTPM